MTLSARERRVLAEMEHRLAADDPALAGLLAGTGRSASSARFPVRLLAVSAAGAAGLVLCVLALVVRDPVWLAVIAGLLFALGVAVVSVGVLGVGARRSGRRSRDARGPVGRRPG